MKTPYRARSVAENPIPSVTQLYLSLNATNAVYGWLDMDQNLQTKQS